MKISFFQKTGYKLFGNYFKKKKDKYHSIQKKIKSARITVPIDYWMSAAAFFALITALILLFFSLMLLFVISNLNLVSFPELSFSMLVNQPTLIVNELRNNLFGFVLWILGLFGPLFLGLFIYFIYQMIPGFKASTRRREIDSLLPYAINYISAMAGAGVTPTETFKLLANSKEVYGEVSEEAKYIIRETEVLGKDLITSMRTISKSTPSNKFQEFLQGTITTITSGGDLETYFKSKANQFIRENRRTQEKFLETLGLMGESYVTAFVAGPLFIIVMVVVMSMMGGASLIILYLIVYAAIPFGSAIFILMVDVISPKM